MSRSLNSTCSTLPQVLLLDDPLKLRDLDGVFVFHASQFTKVSVFEYGVRFTKEIVNEQGQLITRSHHSRLLPVRVD